MRKILVVCKHSRYEKEAKLCERILSKKYNVKYHWKDTLRRGEVKKADLVISIGGDGTALSASHFLFTRPLLSVNSSPKTSEGVLTTTTLKNLHKKIKQIESGKYKTEKLERIEVKINNRSVAPIALNEVFIANEKAYLVSKYKVRINGKTETQKSSGLIFSTGTGSTAWFKSAGGHPFSPQSKFIKLLVREPYVRKLNKFKMHEETIHEGREVQIVPLTKSVLAIDSIREFKLKPNDKVKIKISDYPLLRIK